MPNVPITDQECALTKMRGEETWTVSASDGTMITKLDRAGWPGELDPTGIYKNYKISAAAVTIRSKSAVERPPSPEQRAAWERGKERLKPKAGLKPDGN